MKRIWRSFAVVTILVLTLAAFAFYLVKHPEVGQRLHHTSLELVALLLIMYLGSLLALTLVTIATLRLARRPLGKSESFLLTAYSGLINFFGPLQSGPALRAVYLKKRHGLNLKNYAHATLIYYFFYGSFSSLLLLSGVLKWWTIIPAGAVGLLILFVQKSQRYRAHLAALDKHDLYYLALATLLQVFITSLIYYVELRNVAPGIDYSQTLIYSGAANLVLFVSITPGAIGFRESFLLFTKHLHNISAATIVTANILDRVIYVIFLLILALIVFVIYGRRQLIIKKDPL